MALHEVILQPNTTSTATSAPYLGRYVAKGSVNLSKILEEASSLVGMTSERGLLVYGELVNAIKADFQLGAARYNLKAFTISPTITGDFPYRNSAFNKDTCAYNLQCYFGNEMRNYLAEETPSIVTDETATKVKINQVDDISDTEPPGLINGVGEFTYTGKYLCMNDAGAEMYLANAAGVTICPVYYTMGDETYGTAHLWKDVTAGDYYLHALSRGGDASAPLQNAKKPVKVRANVVDAQARSISSIGEVKTTSATMQINLAEAGAAWSSADKVYFETEKGLSLEVPATASGTVVTVTLSSVWSSTKAPEAGDAFGVFIKTSGHKSNVKYAVVVADTTPRLTKVTHDGVDSQIKLSSEEDDVIISGLNLSGIDLSESGNHLQYWDDNEGTWKNVDMAGLSQFTAPYKCTLTWLKNNAQISTFLGENFKFRVSYLSGSETITTNEVGAMVVA